MPLPPPVVPLSETAIIDEAAAALGQDLAILMDRAGELLAREAQRLVPQGPVLVACGPGNNGGDGYVCARRLAEAGRTVAVWPIQPPHTPLCEAAARRLPTSVARLDSAPTEMPALIIDAILGAGTRGRPREPIASAINALRALKAPVLAADVPSGLGSDGCLNATLTVCLQAAKQELVRPAHGKSYTLESKTVDIGILPAAWQEIQPACLRHFPLLKRNGHKGTHGELLVIGGGIFPGALSFAARAAVLTGCDLVRVWTAGESPLPPTIVAHRQQSPWLGAADPNELTPLLVRASAVLIGPGLGREAGTVEAIQQSFSLAQEMGVPIAVDADGIAVLAETMRNQPPGDGRLLITPHRGEARSLLGIDTVSEEAIHAFARPDRVVLAKAPVDLVTDGWRWQRNHRGNPRLAVGGTGDVLAGLAAGLMARGALPFDAARMAVLWLTTAGDQLWQELGPCYTTDDLLGRLPRVLKEFLEPMRMWPPMSR